MTTNPTRPGSRPEVGEPPAGEPPAPASGVKLSKSIGKERLEALRCELDECNQHWPDPRGHRVPFPEAAHVSRHHFRGGPYLGDGRRPLYHGLPPRQSSPQSGRRRRTRNHRDVSLWRGQKSCHAGRTAAAHREIGSECPHIPMTGTGAGKGATNG